MGLKAYAIIEGQHQRWIKAGAIKGGRDGLIEINGFEHSMSLPYDASGVPSKNISHGP